MAAGQPQLASCPTSGCRRGPLPVVAVPHFRVAAAARGDAGGGGDAGLGRAGPGRLRARGCPRRLPLGLRARPRRLERRYGAGGSGAGDPEAGAGAGSGGSRAVSRPGGAGGAGGAGARGPPRFGFVSGGSGPAPLPAAPFCPRHCLLGDAGAERGRRQAASRPVNRSATGEATGARDAFGRGPGFWYCPSRPEESNEEEDGEEEEERTGLSQRWDVSSEDSDPPYNFCGFKKSFLCEEPARPPPTALDMTMQRLPAPWGRQLTAEEAERNAQELVAEEERMKRKAEKKKLKKKKQKDRKKREKLGQEQKSKQETESGTSSLSGAAGAGHPQSGNAEEGEGWLGPSPSPCQGDSTAPSGEEGEGPAARAEEMEDELDLSCTFIFKARQKAGVRLPAPQKEKPARTDDAEPGKRMPGKAPGPSLPSPPVPQAPGPSLPSPPIPQAPGPSLPSPPAPQAPEPLDMSVVEQSLILAGRGNEAAQKGHYAEAVQAFTEAVKLNPREHRLFGNRSYCYEKLRCYEEALRDAQVALGLQPGWPKGLFRKGKALRGLKRYAEAASTFEELLRRDGADADAAAHLEACRVLLRQSNPCGRSSPGGVPLPPSLLEAGEPPPPSSGGRGSCWDTNTSGFVTIGSSRGQGRAVASSPQMLPPTHPARDCYPLWVGNITPKISRKVLHGAFSRFGEIRFIRMLPERHCAFINYAQKAAAEAAYMAMQDAEVEGSRLVLQLKHPSHATPSPQARWGLPPGGSCSQGLSSA